jgi:DNA-binding LacI/PurR family transcriptional regulator
LHRKRFRSYIVGDNNVKTLVPPLVPATLDWKFGMKGIRALARHLDISIGTVSKALNGRPDINAQTRERVLEAAMSLGYVANQSGRSLRQGATQTIGFMIESNQDSGTDSDNFFMAVFDGVQSVLSKHKLDLIVLPCPSTEDPVDYLRRMVTRGIVDGLIISATRRKDPRVPLLVGAKIPFVSLGRSDTIDHPWIEMDFEGVARQSVERLVARGHRRIAVSLPANRLNLGNLFLSGYKKALKRHGISFDPELAIRVRSSAPGGVALADAILHLQPRPTAVLLSYELVAGGLYRRLKEAGVAPGRDLAVIGFRESPQTRFLSPRLTCFDTSLKDLGVALAQTLLSQMPAFQADYKGSSTQQIWPMTFKPGESDLMSIE